MKKLLLFLMILIPLVVILVVNMATVVVADLVSIPVDSVELDQTTMVTSLGDSCQLSATVMPKSANNKEVVWASSNPEIATVDKNGNVVFSGFGNVYITATTLDNNKKASCYFVVTNSSVMRVYLYTIGNANKIAIGKKIDMQAQVFPAEAINKEIIFSSTNETVASVDENGTVTGLSVGTTTIIATSVDSGDNASFEISIYQPVTDIIMEKSYILCEQAYCYLPYSVLPSNAAQDMLKFSVNDPDIATVNNFGRVIFNKQGTVNVTVEFENIKSLCQIEFTNGYASSLSVQDATKVCNFKDQTWQIEYSVLPLNLYNTTVWFESSNKAVATVDSYGLVEFTGGGSCSITVQAYSSQDTIIQKNILLTVERDTESILIQQNIITAKDSYSLTFQSLPSDNTNDEYYFFTDSAIAQVNQEGIVTFTQSGTANVVVFANEKNSSVSATTSITYTGGKASDFEVETAYNMSVGDMQMIRLNYLPVDTQDKNARIEIIDQTCANGTSDDVVSLRNGVISALKGGTAKLQVVVDCYESSAKTKYIEVVVKQFVSEIVLSSPMEMLENKYITGSQTATFNASVLPLDATEIDLVYTVDDNNACKIFDNIIMFNYPATVNLKATNLDNGVFTIITICYASKIMYVEFNDIPNQINVGEEIVVDLVSYIPSSISYEIILQKVNEKTKVKDVVVSIANNKITGVNGGTVEIMIYVSGIFQKMHELTVIRQAEQVIVTPSNILTTYTQIELSYSILPLDATCQNVIWEVDDPTLGDIENDILSFYGYGSISITAIINDLSRVSCNFYIERVRAEAQDIEVSNKDLELYVGDYAQIAVGEYNSIDYELTQGNSDILSYNSNGMLTAIGPGQVLLKCTCYNKFGLIQDIYDISITVYNRVVNITLNSPDIEMYEGLYYTASTVNNLNSIVSPSEYVKTGVNYSIEENTIAQLADDKLTFYNAGTIKLIASSIDGGCKKIWNITYTGGAAIAVETAFGNVITLQKGQSFYVEISRWIPANTAVKSIQIIVLTSDGLQNISVAGSTITALSSGSINVSIFISGTLTKNLEIIIEEAMQEIKFARKSYETALQTFNLTYDILPNTATDKAVLFSSSDEMVATVSLSGTVNFIRRGMVEIKISSAKNPLIYDICSITCTMGCPTSIQLNLSRLEMTVNGVQQLYIKSFEPADAPPFNIIFTIKQQQPIKDGAEVVSISENGIMTALSGGTAVVKASIIDGEDNSVSAECEIVVSQYVSSFEITLNGDLSSMQQVYYTSKPQLDYTITYLPYDANIIEFAYEISDTSYAKIEDGTIIFLKEGLVSIKFYYLANSNISNTISINYVGDNVTYAKMQESGFTVMPDQSRKRTMAIGEQYQFSIEQIIPRDLLDLEITFKLLSTSPNASNLAVCEAIGSLLFARNGGISSYAVYVNGYFVGNYNFEVIRSCDSIFVEESQIHISKPVYSINAKILPEDTTDKRLSFECDNTDLAQVNIVGEVEFYEIGSVIITVRHIASGKVQSIQISYTKEVESLYFNNTTTVLTKGATVLLKTYTVPSELENVEIAYVSSNEQLATVAANGRVIAGNETGNVVITAYLVSNREIYVSRIFTITQYVTSIALKLDSVGDDLGIKGERVFGTKYLVNDQIINTYQMEILSMEPSGIQVGLLWKSSDETVATVSESGLVTFLKEGKVIIRVEPSVQYNLLRPVYDEYTFILKEGLNVYSYNDICYAKENKLNNIFQADITVLPQDLLALQTEQVIFQTSIYGNGFMFFANYVFKDNGNKIVVDANDIIIDNITFRGEEYAAGQKLSDLTNSKCLLLVYKKNNVRITNCVLENALTLSRPVDSTVYYSGCIFRNAGAACLSLYREENVKVQTIVTINNCIFKDALLTCIFVEFDTSKVRDYPCKIVLTNNVYIYNFRRAEEFKCQMVDDYVPGVSSQISAILKTCENIKHTYNGVDYYNLGIIAMNVNYYLGNFVSSYETDTTRMVFPNPYSWFDINGYVYGINFEMDVFSTPNSCTTLTPASNYDSTIYALIRER